MKRFLLSLTLAIVSASTAFSVTPERRPDTSGRFAFVGFGTYRTGFGGEIPLCTYSIVKHGLLLTAKHCFTHVGSPSNPAQVKNLKVTFPGLVSLSGGDLKDIVLDPGPNDLAYVTYEAARTAALISLPPMRIATALPSLDTPLLMPGFPNAPAALRKLIVSQPCTLNGRHGTFPPKPKDAGYEGELWEMACPAWRGQSGSPLIEVVEEGLVIHGVLTHTFQVKADGAIDPAVIQSDKVGSFVPLSMFSPLWLAASEDKL